MRLPFLFLILFTLAGCQRESFGPRDSAEVFFALVKEGKTADAYERAAASFKLTRTQKYFEARVRDTGLEGFKSVTLGEAAERDGMMRVPAEFQLKDGGAFSLDVGMVKENGAWKLAEARNKPATPGGATEDVFAVMVRSRDKTREGNLAFLEPVAEAVPSERQIEQLVKRTLAKFDDAIKAGDFRDFHASVSDRWKYRGKDPRALNYTGFDEARIRESDPFNVADRLTVPALKQAFQAFVDAKVDLAPLQKARMILDRPALLNSDGVLIVEGTFSATVFQGAFPPLPRKVQFRLEYVFESSDWKLFGITVNLNKLPGNEAPK